MQLFFEQLLNGIAMGSIYALITLGLALVYGILRILHVAHAGVYTVGFNDIGEVVKEVQVQIVKDGRFRKFGIVTDITLITP